MPGDVCRRCRWQHIQVELFGGPDDARCAHPRLERAPAEPGGPVRHPTVAEARARGPGLCGPEARLFEAALRAPRRSRKSA